MMKAIYIREPGGPEVLQMCHRPIPEPWKTEVLIEVSAAGINRPDIMQRKGIYPAPKGVVADIPGLEVSGKIVAIGSKVTRFQVGDMVCALIAGGGYAEFVCAPEGQCIALPEKLSVIEAAGIPETTFTVWHNVFQLGNLRSGDHFLLHGGSSGIGTTAIQLAHATGTRVFTTVGTKAKQEFCRSLGAEIAINYKNEDFEFLLKDIGIDVCLDMIGGDYFVKNMNIMRSDGRIIHINAMNGRMVSLDILQMMLKRIHVTGSTLRSRSIEFKSKLADEIKRVVWPLIEDGKFQPIIYKVLPLEEAGQAHQLMESSEHIGKIILKCRDL